MQTDWVTRAAVPLTILPLYFPLDYISARESFGEFEAGELSFDDYLDALRVEISTRLTAGEMVLLAPIRVDDIEDWAAHRNVDCGLLSVRRSYITDMAAADMYNIRSVALLDPLLRQESLRLLRDGSIEAGLGGGYDVEAYDDALEDCEEVASLAFLQIVAFLGEATSSVAQVSYRVDGILDGEELTLRGEVLLHRHDGGMVMADFPETEEVLRLALEVGQVRRAEVLATCVHAEPEASGAVRTIYGWRMGPEGLLSMSEGEVFSAACTDINGEPVPPQSETAYASTDGAWTW